MCTDEERETPKSVDDVVEVLFAALPRDDIEALRKLGKSELNDLHFGLGMQIRNRFVYPGGEELKRSVALQRGRVITASNGDHVTLIHQDEVSEYIIEALWNRIRKDER